MHLYQSHQLLNDREDEVWKNQQVVLRYGESGSDRESESGSEPGEDSESEDEEAPVPPVKRHKTTSPNKRGTPPSHNTPSPEGKPEEEKAVDPEDPFQPLVKILCDIRMDWERKRRIVVAIGQLVGAAPDRELPEKVAGCISDPVEARK